MLRPPQKPQKTHDLSPRTNMINIHNEKVQQQKQSYNSLQCLTKAIIDGDRQHKQLKLTCKERVEGNV